MGEDIKEKLIPRAVDWFTGEALQFEEVDDDMEEGDFEDEDDDEEDEDDEDHDDDESDDDVSLSIAAMWACSDCNVQDDAAKPKQEAAECKQS